MVACALLHHLATAGSVHGVCGYPGINQNLPSSVVGASGNRASDPVRDLDTLARVAEVPGGPGTHALGITDMTPSDLLGETVVSPIPTRTCSASRSRILGRGRAVRLANEYARQFMNYRTQLQTAVIDNALAPLNRRIETLQKALRGVPQAEQDVTSRQQLSVLLAKRQDLENLRSLQANNLVIVRPASSAPRRSRHGSETLRSHWSSVWPWESRWYFSCTPWTIVSGRPKRRGGDTGDAPIGPRSDSTPTPA